MRRNSDSYEYKNKSARRGAQFVPIGMPTTCWNSVPPKETNMLSMRNSVFSIKTFDFSTLHTTLPRDKLKTRLKETIHKAFSHRNYGSNLFVLGYNSTYFSRSWFQVIQKNFRVFQNPHVIYTSTRVNSFTIFLLSLFYCRQNLCQVNRQFRTVAFLLSKLLTLILQNKTAIIYMKEKEALLYTITIILPP
jgi:hypothetical protein